MSKWTDQMCFQCASEEFEVSVESASVVHAANAQRLAMLCNIYCKYFTKGIFLAEPLIVFFPAPV